MSAGAREQPGERVFRRRRRVALALLAAFALVLAWTVASTVGSGDGAADRPPELPRGGRTILPRYRVVAFYGAPQNQELGVLGIGTPAHAASELLVRARGYAAAGRRPVLPAFELIATI